MKIRNKIWMLSIMMVIYAVLLVGCSFKKEKKNVSVSDSKEYFGTIMTITINGPDEDELIAYVNDGFKEVERLENIFSAKKQDSELYLLNEKAFYEEVVVSDELFYVIKKALNYGDISQGALDISIGQIIGMWSIGTENERVPDDTELETYLGFDGYKMISLNEDKKTVHFLDERVRLDLGAIAKGYAADKVKEYLLSIDDSIYGILNFGGNIMTIGAKEGDNDWNIGITNPFDTAGVYGTVSIKDKCVVTSGNYERYFEKDGVRYHHILNPKTASPANSGVVSATIVGSSSIDCDALSTICFVLGVEKGMKLVENIEGVEAVFIDNEGRYHTSRGIDKYNFKKM